MNDNIKSKKEELKQEEQMDVLNIIGMDDVKDQLDKIGSEDHLTWLQTVDLMQSPTR